MEGSVSNQVTYYKMIFLFSGHHYSFLSFKLTYIYIYIMYTDMFMN